MSVSIVTKILSILTIVGDVVVVLFVLDLLVSRLKGKKTLQLLPKFWEYIKSNSLLFSLIVAFLATAGSLFYSEVAHYAPCKLCWYQRIFMYPFLIIFGVAMYVKDETIYRYTIAMASIGGLIAAYHYYIQVFPEHSPEGCSAIGYAASCSENFILNFGYITIPMMSLTAFALIIVAGLLHGKIVKTKE